MSSPFVYDTDDCDKHQQNDWDGICLVKGTPHYQRRSQQLVQRIRMPKKLIRKIALSFYTSLGHSPMSGTWLEVFKAFSRTKRASLAGELAVNRVNFSLSPRLPRVRRRK